MYRFKIIIALWLSLIGMRAIANDTLRVNLQQADSIFLNKNYYLLASAMNIEAEKAQVMQAKLYPNPVFTATVNAYDPENNKAFHIGQSGQKVFEFEQLIILGGKRKSEIEMAKTNVSIAQLEFQKLVRQLKFRLYTGLFTAGHQKLLIEKYNSQLALLDTLLRANQIQAERGNIPLKDLVRLKGAYLKLNNDRAEILKSFYETQAVLQSLLQTTSEVVFDFAEDEVKKYINVAGIDVLTKEMENNHPDFLLLKQNKILAEQYLAFQKKSAIPDISLYAGYDQRSGAFNNEWNTGISLSLPLWNRNQGNIKTGQFRLKEAEYNLQALQNDAYSELKNTYNFYLQTVAEYRKATNLYNQDFEITLKGMSDNFKKRNVSIIEFVDFFEAYNEVLTELSRIKIQLVNSGEELNLLIGKDIY